MDIDAVLRDIGEYGKFQKILLFFVFLPCMFPCAFQAYNQLFMITSPPNCCSSVVCGDNNFNGFLFKSLNVSYVSKEFLICESEFRITVIWVLFGIAGFVGSYIFGYLQNRIGRQPSFFIYLLILCFFGIGISFVSNFGTWLVFRLGVGFTIPAILLTPTLLPLELVGPKYRTRCSIYCNIAYSLALITLAGIVYVIRNWHFLAFFTAFPFLFFFIYMRYMPESPRWLLSVGEFEKAVRILKKIAQINGRKFTEEHYNFLQKKFIYSKEKFGNSTQYGIKDLFSNLDLRKKTWILMYLWFILTSVYVGLSFYAPSLSGDTFLNFFLAGIAELPTYIILWPAMEFYGRREILCLSMLLGGFACIMTSIITENHNVILFLYCIGKMGTSSAYVVLPLFASELFPTVIRSIGLSVVSIAGMLGPIFIPIVNYMGIGSYLPLVIMGILLIIGGLISLLLPETKDICLPESITNK